MVAPGLAAASALMSERIEKAHVCVAAYGPGTVPSEPLDAVYSAYGAHAAAPPQQRKKKRSRSTISAAA